MPRFKPPTPEETQRALGPLESLPANLVRALTDVSAFSRLPKPRRGEWLAEFPEPGQSLKQYERRWAKCSSSMSVMSQVNLKTHATPAQPIERESPHAHAFPRSRPTSVRP